MDLARPLIPSSSKTPARSARRGPDFHSLSIRLSDASEDPPTEFRIFTAGKVETVKGDFLFDEKSAKSVMAEYREHGIDLMIDYDHASLGSFADPALAGRAAGWFKPEVREGELWATGVTWSPPADQALRNKEWRFMSPAFSVDDENRITSLLNVALTNLPATRRLEPLMAANAKGNIIMASELSPKLVNQALEAVASKDAKAALDLMKQILAALLGGSPDDTEPTDDPAPLEPDAAAASVAAAVDKAASMAACARLALALTGKSSLGEAMTELSRRSGVALDLEKREKQLSADRATLESGERRELVGTLVKLGYEIPALAWSDEKGTVPSDTYAEMPMARLRERVDALSAKGPRTKTPETPKDDPVTGVNELGLSEREMKLCAEKKLDPKKYAATKNRKS